MKPNQRTSRRTSFFISGDAGRRGQRALRAVSGNHPVPLWQGTWATEGESRRRYKRLRRYVYATDRIVQANTTYTSDPNDKFDHLNDYFAPRYRYEGIDVLPGGEIFTRIEGDYAAAGDREREAYIRSLSKQPGKVYAEVYTAGEPKLRCLASERLAYTGRRRPAIEGLLEQTSDSTMLANYRSRKEAANDRLAELNNRCGIINSRVGFYHQFHGYKG